MTTTNTTSKITYVSTINAVLTAIRDQSFAGITEEHVDKLVALGQSLEKRNSTKSTKPTKKQAENGNIKLEILKVMTTEGQKCGEIAEKVGISGPKCSALLTQLVNTEQVEKYTEKRTSLFRLPQ